MTPRAQIAGRVAAIVFFVAYALLFLFIDRFRNGVPQSFVLFWALIAAMFISLMYQIAKLSKGLATESLIVFQLLLVSFFFHVIHVVLSDGLMFLQDDSYTMIRSAEYIQQGHRDFFSAGPEYGQWPFSQLLLLTLSGASGLSLFNVSYYLPAVINTIGTVFVYLLARTAYGDRRVAFLAFLAFSFFWRTSEQHYSSHPEFVGYVFFMACLFTLFRGISRPLASSPFLAGAALFGAATIPTNSTTSVFLAGILVVGLLALGLTRLYPRRGPTPAIAFTPFYTFALFALVATLAYMAYVTVTPFEFMVRTVGDIRSPIYAPAMQEAALGVAPAPPTLRQNVAGDGMIFYVLVFGVAMVVEMITRPKCPQHYFDAILTLWGGVGFVLYLAWGLFPTGTSFLAHFGGRVEVFTYPFLMLGAAHALAHVDSLRRHIMVGVLLFGLVTVSVSSLQFLPGNLVGTSARPPEVGDNSQEWAAIGWLRGTLAVYRLDASTTVSPYSIAHLIRYEFGGYTDTSIEFWGRNLEVLRERHLDWVFWNQEKPIFETFTERRQQVRKRLDPDTVARIPHTPWLAPIYDNQEWVIYRVVR